MPDRIALNGAAVDLSQRFSVTKTVAASPAAGSITTIATLTLSQDVVIASGIQLFGWVAFTAGTNAVGATLQIRQASTTGSVIADTGAATVVATKLYAISVQGLDTAAVLPGQVYVLCLTMASGSASSTVSALQLAALIV